MKQLKIQDAIDFIRAQGIEDMTDDDLTMLIRKSINTHGFDYVSDAEGNILGLYLGLWEQPFTIFRVHLLLGRNTMRTLMRRFKSRFPFLEKVVTGRHKHKVGVGKATYTDECKEVEYTPEKFKLIS
jgi:hypothetical protein